MATTTPRTIAQGLRRIKDLQGSIAKLDSKIAASSRWTQGEEPAYKFDELVTERDGVENELTSLRTRIAVANATNHVMVGDKSMLLVSAVHQQTELKGRIALFNKVSVQPRREVTVKTSEVQYDEVTGRPVRVPSETVTCVALTERERSEKVDALQSELRALDEALQDANHTTALPV
jgi:hypothetical protein